MLWPRTELASATLQRVNSVLPFPRHPESDRHGLASHYVVLAHSNISPQLSQPLYPAFQKRYSPICSFVTVVKYHWNCTLKYDVISLLGCLQRVLTTCPIRDLGPKTAARSIEMYLVYKPPNHAHQILKVISSGVSLNPWHSSGRLRLHPFLF